MDELDDYMTRVLSDAPVFIEPKSAVEALQRRAHITAQRKAIDQRRADTVDREKRRKYNAVDTFLKRELDCLNTSLAVLQLLESEDRKLQQRIQREYKANHITQASTDEIRAYFEQVDFNKNSPTMDLLIHAYLLLDKTHRSVRKRFWSDREIALVETIRFHFRKYGADNDANLLDTDSTS